MFTYRLEKTKNAHGEYVIRCYLDGNKYPNGNYYTDDWNDAKQTYEKLKKDLTTVNSVIS